MYNDLVVALNYGCEFKVKCDYIVLCLSNERIA